MNFLIGEVSLNFRITKVIILIKQKQLIRIFELQMEYKFNAVLK